MAERVKYWLLGLFAAGVVLAMILAAGFAWISTSALPQPGSPRYDQAVSAFYTGVVALDVDAKDRAKAALARASQLVPAEPASWANRGLLELRDGNFDEAALHLNRARALAPRSAEVERLIGLLESQRGEFETAVAHLRRAVEIDPGDLKARFALMQAIERLGVADSDAQAKAQVDAILERQPDNLLVKLEHARLAAKAGDAAVLGESIAALEKDAAIWPANAQEQLRALKAAAQDNPRLAATRVAFLRNVLLPTPVYRKAFDAVQTPSGVIGQPITHFLKLPPPAAAFDVADTSLSHVAEVIADVAPEGWNALVATPLDGDAAPSLFVANGREVRVSGKPAITLSFPGGPSATPPTAHGVLPVTLDADDRVDLALAGAGGVALFRQQESGVFADVTAESGVSGDVLGADCFGAWSADLELDGDLDLVVAPRAMPPFALRNNNDGTFEVLRPFEQVATLRDFVWADFDHDGDPDAALLDAEGRLHVASNERAGQFLFRAVPDAIGMLRAIAPGDLNNDGAIDLVALRADGGLMLLSDVNDGQTWRVTELAAGAALDAPARLFVEDLDNNGAVDVVASGAGGGHAWLAETSGTLQLHTLPAGLNVMAIGDFSGDGLLDLAGLGADGQAQLALGRGTKNYHWQAIRPRAAVGAAAGDGRINPFGVGGQIDVRSALLVQTQIIAGPIVHFGLGSHANADVARIIWPNGTVQAEFDLTANQAVVAQQRLKGSCPFLFAFDGTRVQFVTDFLWRSPLGLRINGQDTAGIAQTEDWVKIRGDQLAPVDGAYDIRTTADLWETHFFDHMALLVVDHPEETEIFVDERFSPRKPPALAVHATGPLHAIARAVDDGGQDVTDLVRARDGRYVDNFGRGAYQGVTRDHWVEIELASDAPDDRPLCLVAHGWTHPTDSSLNVAISQGRHDPPRGLVLEVPGQDGQWRAAIADLGFPAGKNKTILVPLNEVFAQGAPRRCRLHTNLEVYWDSLEIAEALPEAPLQTTRLVPSRAELRYRGFSAIDQGSPSAPELPDYVTLTGTTQRWRDLIGFYTRHGDVLDLVTAVDDRYVIANAGDELLLRFPALAAPAPGLVRDFVMIGDGWNKDGDYNTAFSKTVLPLPLHDQTSYSASPGLLEDDPAFRRHPNDWLDYHTRYITPRDFQQGLRSRDLSSPQGSSTGNE